MADFTTRNARKRLQRRGSPRWARIARGRALGYRREPGEGPGRWYTRVRVGGNGGSPYRWKMVGTADDLPHVPANGDDVLTYAQAIKRASAWDPHADPNEPSELVTVADVCGAYLEWADEHRRSAQESRYTINAHILPVLGEIAVADLTVDRLRRWHAALGKNPARMRSSKGKQQRFPCSHYRGCETGATGLGQPYLDRAQGCPKPGLGATAC